jgi:hypothetical protein
MAPRNGALRDDRSGVHRIPSDVAGAALVSQVGPEPVQHDGDAVASTREEQHVGKAPKPSGGRSPQPKPAHFQDSSQAPDRREIAVMPVLKGIRHWISFDRRPDHARDMRPCCLPAGARPGTTPPAHPVEAAVSLIAKTPGQPRTKRVEESGGKVRDESRRGLSSHNAFS